MKTKLLPLSIILGLSIVSVSAHAWDVDIPRGDSPAYVQDSDGNIVRDRWGQCVRTIHWSKETAIAKCEGWEEAKPVVEVKPTPAPVPKPTPVIAPAPVAEPEPRVVAPATLAFTGFFEVDGSNLTAEAKAKLDEYVEFLNDNPNKRLNIQGHTDSTGSVAHNQKLSERRANQVKSYLESQGISSNRLRATGAGELLPAATNETAEGRAHNRRVVIQILD